MKEILCAGARNCRIWQIARRELALEAAIAKLAMTATAPRHE
jgi:hypothetical protein